MPNHFLRLRSSGQDNNPVQICNLRMDLSDRKVREIWEHITGVIEKFWNVFQKHYLTFLREKHTVSYPSNRGSLALVLMVNQVVLVKEPGERRSNWKLGRIISLDDRDTVALVQRKNSVLTRSVNFLYPLAISSEKTSEIS